MAQSKRSTLRYLIKVIAFLLFLYGLFTWLTPDANAQTNEADVISGKVLSKKGEPLYLVHVKVAGTAVGDVTDEEGVFSFRYRNDGPFELQISLLGYGKRLLPLDPNSDELTGLEITLKEETITSEQMKVSGSAFTSGDEKGVTVSPIEVVTTPGTAADVFRAMKTFPGTSMVDEGSGLFVRGGDLSETKILLDQATVAHPYRFENPTGGVFGTIPPFMISGTYFSTGGFPARFGNALSGVLAMESLDMPKKRSLNLNMGMAAASVGLDLPSESGKWGVRFTGNRSFTGFMFDLNGMGGEFLTSPIGMDGNLSIQFKPSPKTSFKLFSFANTNRLGVEVPEPGFTAIFDSRETNRLHNLQWGQMAGAWYGETSLSWNAFSNRQNYGGLAIDQQDHTLKLRTDWERPLGSDFYLRIGGEWESLINRMDGRVPNQGILNPDAQFTDFNASYTIGRTAAWSELNYEFGGRWVANLGIRSDQLHANGSWVADPRFSLTFKPDARQTLRFTTGLYHQFAQPMQFNPDTGNPDLGAQQAAHYIATYEYQQNLLHGRAEIYHKQYDDLVIADEASNLSNDGYGYARGVDLFLKYSEYLTTRFNGWISYSFLQSERLQSLESNGAIRRVEAPSSFDITHNLTVVAKYQVIGFFTVGATYRYATGRPITPITGGQSVDEGAYYLPMFGAINSERLPSFQRLDLDISQYIPFGNGHSLVIYASVSNALNRRNVMDYSYNEQYTERTPVESNYARFIYTGATLSLSI